MRLSARHVTESFDPAAGPGSPSLSTFFDRARDEWPALLLVAGEDARHDGWAARAAASLAGAWAARGDRVVLVDLSLESPELHDAVGETNGEGIADVFLFGASLKRVARPVGDGELRFVPAGLYVPDPAGVLSHPRWDRVLAGFRELGATLCLYVPIGAPGLDELSARVSHAVVLASKGEAESLARKLPATCIVEATLVPPAAQVAAADGSAEREPPGDPGAEADAARTEAAPADSVAEEWLSAVGAPDRDAGEPVRDDPGGGESALAAAAAAGKPMALAPDLTEPPVATSPGEESRSGWRLRVALFILLAVAIAVAAWFGLRRPGGGVGMAPESPAAPLAATAGESAPPQAPAPPGPPPEPLSEPLDYSVAVEAHRGYTVARDRARMLRRAEPEIGFYVVPVLVDDVVYYRVMAGPAATDSAAAEVMRRLVEAGHKTAYELWSLRPTAFAFDLGEFEVQAAARARELAMDSLGVPAYLVEVPYSDGSVRYRVYAGAYMGPAEAVVLEQVLDRLGVTAEFVRRAGRPVS